MKNFKKTITTLLISLLTVVSFAQKGSVWATVSSVNKLKSNPNFQTIVTEQQGKLTYEKTFPSSRQESLQKVYEFTCDCDVVSLYRSLHKVSDLSGIEFGPTYETLELPNDYTVSYQKNWPLDLIQAEAAWYQTTGDPSLNVAISDQNYYNTHEELNGKIKYYDSTNTAARTHGTAVATIVGGNTNNGVGLASIGYNTTLNLYRMNFNDVIVASNNGAKIINLSWASSCSFNPYAQAAIDEVYNNGTFIVAAAGNGTTCNNPDALVYPAAYNHVFAVTSIGSKDNIERVGGLPSTRHQTNSSVDLCAPGYDVPLTQSPGSYTYSSGTSFAAPFVTGTISLMLSLKPDLTNEEIDSVLRVSATNIDNLNLNYIGKIGSGRLNAGAAIKTVQEMIYKETVVDDGYTGDNDSTNGSAGYTIQWDVQTNNNTLNLYGKHNDETTSTRPVKEYNNNNYGWDITQSELSSRTDLVVIDANGKTTNLEEALPGIYFIVNNGVIIKRIYKS